MARALFAHAVVPLLLAVGLSGCFGGDDAGPASTEESSAAPAQVDASTGGIDGVVMDEESNPVEGAEVGLADTEERTLTDASGAFSFSRLRPGAYTLVVADVGFQSVSRPVEIQAGEVELVEVTLEAVAVSASHQTVQIQRGLFGCGASWRPPTVYSGIAICGVYSLLLNDTTYDNFLLLWTVNGTTEWSSSVMEMSWDSSQFLGRGLSMIWEVDGCPNEGAFRFGRSNGYSPLRFHVDQETITGVMENTTHDERRDDCDTEEGEDLALKNCNEESCIVMSRVFSSPDSLGATSPADVGVTWQQPFEQYHTIFYGDPAPLDYTALPDA